MRVLLIASAKVALRSSSLGVTRHGNIITICGGKVHVRICWFCITYCLLNYHFGRDDT